MTTASKTTVSTAATAPNGKVLPAMPRIPSRKFFRQ
jgi:hypothetical protein